MTIPPRWWSRADQSLRIRAPRLWSLRPVALLALVTIVPVGAWTLPRLGSTGPWAPLDADDAGLVWLVLSALLCAAWSGAMLYRRASIALRSVRPPPSAMMLFAVFCWTMAAATTLSMRAADGVNRSFRCREQLLEDARFLHHTVVTDGRELVGDPSLELDVDRSDYEREHRAICDSMAAAPAGFVDRIAIYVAPEHRAGVRAELLQFREDCARSVPAGPLGAGANAVRSLCSTLDRLSRAHAISTLAGPQSLKFTWLGFALGAVVIFTCFTVGIGSLGMAPMLRATIVATIADIALRAYESSLSDENWGFYSMMLSRAPTVTTIAAVVLAAGLCLVPRLSRRFRSPLLSLCFVAPALATVVLFHVQPTLRVRVASTTVAGIELPIPAHRAQEVLVWLVVSYLLLTPIVTLSLYRLRSLPEQR